MESQVISPTGKITIVKNLGWLIRNRNKYGFMKQVGGYRIKGKPWDAVLVVVFNDGTVYISPFMDFVVMVRWIKDHLSRHIEAEHIDIEL